MSALLELRAPMSGWVTPLADAPDAVFAQGMAGAGIAIDPTDGVVHAPCDGEIVPMRGASHAVTVRAAGGIDVLVHVGIDTVKLGGRGFELLVSPGARVRAGELLLRFDLDAVACAAASLVSPVVLASGGEVARVTQATRVKVGDFLFAARAVSGAASMSPALDSQLATFRVPFEHGLHVRPAAQVASALRPFAARVVISCQGEEASARSPVAMMTLGVRCGDMVQVRAEGIDAAEALQALAALFARVPVTPPAVKQPPARGRHEAIVASRGVALGPSMRWSETQIEPLEHGGDTARERTALEAAIATVAADLEQRAIGASGAQRAILQAHRELVLDPQLLQRADAAIAQGRSAGSAWRDACRTTAERLRASADARVQERAADLRDLERQLLRALQGKAPAFARELPAGCIVIAEEILPSQLLALQAAGAAGFCTAAGGATSHVALLATAAGLPALVAAGPEVLRIEDGTVVVLDAEHGWLDIDPPAAERAALERALAQRAAERTSDLATARQAAVTRDGIAIAIHANLGALDEVEGALAHGAEGCGLLRTEFLFLDRAEAPSEDEQRERYASIAAALGGRPLAIRTLDAGGDKPIAYMPMPREDNPALGLRGVRGGLRDPQLLRTQLRAIVRAASPRQCRILVPMVTEPAELAAVRAMLDECGRELGRETLPLLGVMIETPASAVLAAELAEHADFFSIGTNDLSQYALAIDRGHPELARRLDALHPAVLRLMAAVVSAAATRERPVAVCGALASDAEALPLLIGLGIRELSATPAAIPRLKRIARQLHARGCAELAQRALAQSAAGAVRELCAQALAQARADALPSPVPGGSP